MALKSHRRVQFTKLNRTLTVKEPDTDNEFEIVICDDIAGMSFFVSQEQASDLLEFIKLHYKDKVH